jgi:hypothetical protein
MFLKSVPSPGSAFEVIFKMSEKLVAKIYPNNTL